jgi:protein-tyrosine phosphatase
MTLRILVVCTANVCRSPVAERLLLQRLTERGIASVVTSAGTRGGKLAIHDDTVAAAHQIGLDVADHRSRRLDAPLIRTEGADLVIGMTREHLREVVALEPAAWPRTFTLKELARAATRVGPVETSVADWVASASAGRRAADLMAPSDDDGLADPYGLERRAHVGMVDEVDGLTRRIAAALAPS